MSDLNTTPVKVFCRESGQCGEYGYVNYSLCEVPQSAVKDGSLDHNDVLEAWLNEKRASWGDTSIKINEDSVLINDGELSEELESYQIITEVELEVLRKFVFV
jgi:hypothetical protein